MSLQCHLSFFEALRLVIKCRGWWKSSTKQTFAFHVTVSGIILARSLQDFFIADAVGKSYVCVGEKAGFL